MVRLKNKRKDIIEAWNRFSGSPSLIAEKRKLFVDIILDFGIIEEEKIKKIAEVIEREVVEDKKEKKDWLYIYLKSFFRDETEMKAINELFEKFKVNKKQKIEILKNSTTSFEVYKELIRKRRE
ncbi:MAG: hypothetical protein ACPLXS_02420 [Candidatus Micrarchaeales archaeon]